MIDNKTITKWVIIATLIVAFIIAILSIDSSTNDVLFFVQVVAIIVAVIAAAIIFADEEYKFKNKLNTAIHWRSYYKKIYEENITKYKSVLHNHYINLINSYYGTDEFHNKAMEGARGRSDRTSDRFSDNAKDEELLRQAINTAKEQVDNSYDTSDLYSFVTLIDAYNYTDYAWFKAETKVYVNNNKVIEGYFIPVDRIMEVNKQTV